jgi:hypothetical protein
MRHSRALGAFTFVVAMLALSPTRAFDDRFHGSVCVGKTPTDAGKLAYSNWGAGNMGPSGSATVICPMGYMSGGASFGSVIWHDAPSQVVSCFYYLGTEDGHRVVKSPVFQPGLPFNQEWVVNPYADDAQLLEGTGYLYLECTLPGPVNGAQSIVASVWLND